MSKRRLRKAIVGAAALYGLNKMMAPTAKGTVSNAQKQTQLGANTPKPYKPKSDSIKLGESITGGPTLSIGVDKNALPAEKKAIADKYKPILKIGKENFLKKKKEGRLSPTMPKSKSQIRDNDPLDPFSAFGLGAKKGKMVKARGGGMARSKPTKMY